MSSSKILKIASRYDEPEIKTVVFSLLDYLIDIVSVAEKAETLENDLEVLYMMVIKNPDQKKYISDKILKAILNFMMVKPKYRRAVTIILK